MNKVKAKRFMAYLGAGVSGALTICSIMGTSQALDELSIESQKYRSTSDNLDEYVVAIEQNPEFKKDWEDAKNNFHIDNLSYESYMNGDISYKAYLHYKDYLINNANKYLDETQLNSLEDLQGELKEQEKALNVCQGKRIFNLLSMAGFSTIGCVLASDKFHKSIDASKVKECIDEYEEIMD